MTCRLGASVEQQQILAQYPDADLAVDVIWMPMLPSDARDKWDSQFLTDPRVTQLWDAERLVGRWVAQEESLQLGDTGAVVWDAFLLFGPEATWESAPAGLLAWGTPIVGRVPQLMDALEPLLTQETPATAMLPAALAFPDRKESVVGTYGHFVA